MAMLVTDHAVQILGGHGYIRDHPVEMWMRNGRGFAAFEGLFASTDKRTFAAHVVAADDPAAIGVKQRQAGQCKEAP